VSYTKRQVIQAALSEIGLATYAFDLSADQIEQAAWRLDAMLGEWNARGIRLGYPLPANPHDTDATSDAGVPDSAYEAVITNLAVRLGPSYGKSVSPDTRATARASFNTLMAMSAKPPEMRVQGIPKGAGYKDHDSPFMPPLDSGIVEYPEPTLTFE
jgi:hypothetical protein